MRACLFLNRLFRFLDQKRFLAGLFVSGRVTFFHQGAELFQLFAKEGEFPSRACNRRNHFFQGHASQLHLLAEQIGLCQPE